LYLKFQDFFGKEMLFDCNGIVIVIVIGAGPSSLSTARNSALNLKRNPLTIATANLYTL